MAWNRVQNRARSLVTLEEVASLRYSRELRELMIILRRKEGSKSDIFDDILG